MVSNVKGKYINRCIDPHIEDALDQFEKELIDAVRRDK